MPDTQPPSQQQSPPPPPPSWFKNRSPLEYCLLIICIGLLALSITLAFLLKPAHVPLETDWGNVAEWVGVVVTFFGFVGAFGALMLQRKSVEIQVDQHLAEISAKNEAAATQKVAKEAAAAAHKVRGLELAKKDREKWAHQVVFTPDAKHQQALKGQVHPEDGMLTLELLASTDSTESFREVSLTTPPLADGYQVRIDREKARTMGGKETTTNVHWKVTGPQMFNGDDNEAITWFKDHVHVEFTDPAGLRWRKDGHGKITELSSANSMDAKQK